MAMVSPHQVFFACVQLSSVQSVKSKGPYAPAWLPIPNLWPTPWQNEIWYATPLLGVLYQTGPTHPILFPPIDLIVTCKNNQVNRDYPNSWHVFGDYSVSMGVKSNQVNSAQPNSKVKFFLFFIYLNFIFIFTVTSLLPFISFHFPRTVRYARLFRFFFAQLF